MKKQHLPLLPLCFAASLFVSSIPALAAENESPANEMNNLVALEQYQQAYDLGDENLEEWGRRP